MRQIGDDLKRFIKDSKFQSAYQKTLEQIFQHPEIRAFYEEHADEIDDDMTKNSLSKLNEFMREKNLYDAGKEGQNPGFVPELYINGNYIDVRYVPSIAFLEAQEQRQAKARINNRTMPIQVRQAKIQDIHLAGQKRQELVEAMTRFVEQYQINPHQAQGYYVYGPFGVGKTFILGAFANQLALKGHSVAMIHFPIFLNELKSTFKDNTTQSVIDEVKEVDILIIDDIGAETFGTWSRDDVLAPIIEFRMNEALPTFFTSNFDMKSLERQLSYTKEGNDEPVKAQRLMERIKFLSKELSLDGPNLRQQIRGGKNES